MSGLFGGGGGGSPPTAPKLKQVSTSLTGPLYTQSAALGDQWAALMRGSYGLGAGQGPPSWEAKYLGPGALAGMGQAKQEIMAPGQDPQLGAVLSKGFGGGFSPGQGRFGGAGAGSSWDLGATPFQVAKELGQTPLQQLQRGQAAAVTETGLWKPPQLRLTGADLLNVQMGQMAQNAQQQQLAYQAQLAGSSAAAQAQAAAQASEIGAVGKFGSGLINAYSNYNNTLAVYATSSGVGNFFGEDFSPPPSDVAPGGAGGGSTSF